jgi:nucleolar protein 56
MILTTTWFGTFLIDPVSGDIQKQKLFPVSVPKLADRLNAIQNLQILKEEKGIVKGLKEPIMVTDQRLTGLGDIVEAVTTLPDTVELLPVDFGFQPELLHDVMLELGKHRTRIAVAADYHVIQAIKGLDDLTQTANLLSERLHEWYGLHWPELDRLVKENEYINLISEHGDRKSIVELSKSER